MADSIFATPHRLDRMSKTYHEPAGDMRVVDLWRVVAWNNTASDPSNGSFFVSEGAARGACEARNKDRQGARHDYVTQRLSDAIREYADARVSDAMDEG